MVEDSANTIYVTINNVERDADNLQDKYSDFISEDGTIHIPQPKEDTEEINSSITFYYVHEENGKKIMLDRETVPVVYNGKDGIGRAVLDLDNEMGAVSLGDNLLLESSVTFLINAAPYINGKLANIVSIERSATGNTQAIKDITGEEIQDGHIAVRYSTSEGKIYIDFNATSGYTFNFGYNEAGQLIDRRQIALTFVVEDSEETQSATITKVFTVIGIPGGKDGDAYRLMPSEDQIIIDYSSANIPSYSTDYVSCEAFLGEAKLDDSSIYFSIDKSFSTFDEEMLNYSEKRDDVTEGILINGSSKHDKVEKKLVFYLIGEGNVILDRETVPVIRNAMGDIKAIMDISNEMVTMPKYDQDYGDEEVIDIHKVFVGTLSASTEVFVYFGINYANIKNITINGTEKIAELIADGKISLRHVVSSQGAWDCTIVWQNITKEDKIFFNNEEYKININVITNDTDEKGNNYIFSKAMIFRGEDVEGEIPSTGIFEINKLQFKDENGNAVSKIIEDTTKYNTYNISTVDCFYQENEESEKSYDKIWYTVNKIYNRCTTDNKNDWIKVREPLLISDINRLRNQVNLITFYLVKNSTESFPVANEIIDRETIYVMRSYNGAVGRNGAVVRGPYKWDSDEVVRHFCNGQETDSADTALWIDIILKDDEYYYCNTPYEGTLSDDWNTVKDKWTKSDQKYDFIATNLLLATDAKINFLSNNELYLMDDNNSITAGAKGGSDINFWAGPTNEGTDLNNAPFIVNNKGELKATKAEIEGKITATLDTEEYVKTTILSPQFFVLKAENKSSGKICSIGLEILPSYTVEDGVVLENVPSLCAQYGDERYYLPFTAWSKFIIDTDYAIYKRYFVMEQLHPESITKLNSYQDSSGKTWNFNTIEDYYGEISRLIPNEYGSKTNFDYMYENMRFYDHVVSNLLTIEDYGIIKPDASIYELYFYKGKGKDWKQMYDLYNGKYFNNVGIYSEGEPLNTKYISTDIGEFGDKLLNSGVYFIEQHSGETVASSTHGSWNARLYYDGHVTTMSVNGTVSGGTMTIWEIERGVIKKESTYGYAKLQYSGGTTSGVGIAVKIFAPGAEINHDWYKDEDGLVFSCYGR